MKPKEKAKELVDRFFTDGDKGLKKVETHINYECAKQCALICVEESINFIFDKYAKTIHHRWVVLNEDIKFWKEVKQEIEKL